MIANILLAVYIIVLILIYIYALYLGIKLILLLQKHLKRADVLIKKEKAVSDGIISNAIAKGVTIGKLKVFNGDN